ncbi:fructosamine kinase family protein [Prochlorococcus sp. MIT 1223]|uniref:fructosamine kinase family protein n=1 Tax=Prochlorococcus sp. MIT 1223 TaxID=3096217 RepID=UPI002A74CEF8|nr:fructosamine kinase family protein [Prochlorococcus sp. MIT 1223]
MQELIVNELRKEKNIFPETEIKTIVPVSGGSIHKSWHIELKNGKHFFAKTTAKEKFEMLKFEVQCLEELTKFANKELLEIPHPISIKQLNQFSILLLPWLDLRNRNQTNLGKGLAMLHKNSENNNQEKFGWPNDGFIGSNLQKGGWMKNWGEFFVEFRLKPQLSLAAKQGKINGDFQRFLGKVISFLNQHDPKPALVHGDLWGGNVATNKNNKGILFDPASYWADKEVDIAMTYLFGGFTNDFYNAYNEISPQSELAIKRIDIYNLYHLINHANIFGGSYINQSLLMMKKLNLYLS